MFGQSDKDYFDSLWKRKLNDNSYSEKYVPGANLRVDEALKTLPTGKRLLDIGCGSGILLQMAQNRFEDVRGIDIAEPAVALTRQKNIQAEIVNLNVDRISFPDGYFDAITILSVIQYFYDMDRVLQECSRVLSSSGILLLSVPNIRAIWRVMKLFVGGSFPGVSLDTGNYDGGTLHYFATSNIRILLARNGFDVLSTKGIFCKPKTLAVLTDRGVIGTLKREFFSAEVFVTATKRHLENTPI